MEHTTEPTSRQTADYATIDGLLFALYDVISGPAGVEPDWRREHELFAPGARLMPSRVLENGDVRCEMLTVDDYIASRGPYLRDNAFYERQVAAKIDQYGHIAHVFSSYESSETPEGPPFSRGVNSIQLIHAKGRWWVQSILWTSEWRG
jgi:hypothetical protein